MAFEWLDRLQRGREKGAAEVAKGLAAYRLGRKGGGALAGVAVRGGAGCCAEAARLERTATFEPSQVPALPLPGCDRAGACRCGYRPVMTYERPAELPAPAADPEDATGS
jgi:hypothetical protein